MTNKDKWKTKKCKFYNEYYFNGCKYGDLCTYAHGDKELINMNKNKKNLYIDSKKANEIDTNIRLIVCDNNTGETFEKIINKKSDNEDIKNERYITKYEFENISITIDSPKSIIYPMTPLNTPTNIEK